MRCKSAGWETLTASVGAFFSNLGGAFAMLVRYREPQLFEYRLRLALAGASLVEDVGTQVIRTDGFTFHVRNPLEALLATTKHERGLLEKFRFRKGGVFLDVGAHIGVYSVRAAKLGMSVHCWEPNPGNRAILVKNLVANGLSAEVHAEALGDAEGYLPFHLSGEQSSFNLSAGPVMNVHVATLDGYDLKSVDIVKLDVEGYEVKVLTGARKTLRRCKPEMIVELHPFYNPDTGSECSSLLKEEGYEEISMFRSKRTDYLLASHKQRRLLRSPMFGSSRVPG